MWCEGFEQVPKQVWENLEYEIARAELEYADNYRAYRVKDDLCREAFLQAVRQGCCGSFESSTTVAGDKWIIGCNYGH